MEINEKKLKRQLQIVQKWVENKACGCLIGATGFGKTYVAILAIQRMHRKYPNATVNVVVPSVKLLEDWVGNNGHIQKHNLHNVNVYVVNTYIRYLHVCDLLVLDEIHHYVSEEFGKTFDNTTYKFVLGLTATLERIDGKHEIIQNLCPVIEEITLEEARRQGYVSDYKVFNWGLDLSEEDRIEYDRIHSIFNKNFAKFGFEFSLAMACSTGKGMTTKIGEVYKTGDQWRVSVATRNDWDGTREHYWSPENVGKAAQQWSWAMRERKKLIYRATVKIQAVKELVNKFNLKTMTFAEDTEFADKLAEVLGNKARAYHTKIKSIVRTERIETVSKKGEVKVVYKDKKISGNRLKEESLELFKQADSGVDVLSTVKSLDEGFDFHSIGLAIMASYNSGKRQDNQRTGRAIRVDYSNADKVSIIVNLYIKESQEEKWLKEKQKGKRGIKWVDSIDEIVVQEDLNFELCKN